MRLTAIFPTSLAIVINLFLLSRANAQNISSTPDAVKTGAVLYTELRCGLCHNVAASGVNIPPALANAGDKLQTKWMEAYLKAPYRRRWESTGMRPILRMPNFLLSDEEARVLTAFLATRHDSVRLGKFALSDNDSSRVAEGKQIFHEYACYGCHKIAGQGGEVGPDLSSVGSRLRPDYLVAFLQNPQAFIPGSPMKISELWEDEVRSLVAYLVSLKFNHWQRGER